MTCGSCGSPNADGAPVCVRCGQKLGSWKPTLVGQSHSGGSAPRGVASKVEQALVGETIANRYVLREMLGRGGVGVVYRATDRVLGEEIAIKLLHPQPNRDPRELERFKREVLTAKKITHPNVVRIDYFGFVDEAEQEAFLAMELLTRGSLASRIARAPIPIPDGIDIAIGICDGLDAAHKKGIVHRDLKPDNVLFDDADVPKIVDFGLARLANSTARTQGFSGTPFYMAPEQADGGDPTVQSDLYSLGVLLFEVFTGRLPFQSESLVRLVMQHTKEAPPAPRSIRAEVPPEIEALVLQALEKDPRRRQRSVEALAAALRAAKTGRRPAADATVIRRMPDAVAPDAKIAAAPPPVPDRARPGAAFAFAGGVALLAIAAGVFFWNRDHDRGPTATTTPVAARPHTPVPDTTRAETTPPGEETAAPTPRETSTPIARATTPRAAAARSATPVSAPSAAPAATKVAVATKQVPFHVGADRGIWVIVTIDGTRHESPVQTKVSPGTYRVRFENAGLGFDETHTINVPENARQVKYHVAKGVNGKLVLQRLK